MLVSVSPGMIQEVEGRMRNHLTLKKEGMQPRKLLPNRKLGFPSTFKRLDIKQTWISVEILSSGNHYDET